MKIIGEPTSQPQPFEVWHEERRVLKQGNRYMLGRVSRRANGQAIGAQPGLPIETTRTSLPDLWEATRGEIEEAFKKPPVEVE